MARDFDKFCDKWLGKKVSFCLLGKDVIGEVTEATDNFVAKDYLVVEFFDGKKTVKVGAHCRNFKLIEEVA